MHRHRAIAGVLVAASALALPAALAAAEGKRPTRLWYRLDVFYSYSYEHSFSGPTLLTDTRRKFHLRFATDESVLLRKGGEGLGFVSNGSGRGNYVKLETGRSVTVSTSPNVPDCWSGRTPSGRGRT
jgi:hypothetical protein